MFATLAVIGASVLVLAYVMFVRTRLGQHVDDGAYLGRLDEGSSVAAAFRRLLNVIEPVTIAVMIGALILIGVVRRIPLVAAMVTAAMILAILLAEVLKRVLPRPALDPEWEELIGKTDSYPSGHTTIVATFVLALLIVTTPRLRALVQVLGTLLVAAVGMGVVIAGWHRPSDVIGGLSLAVCVMGAMTCALTWRRGHSIEPLPSSYRGAWEVAAVTGLLMAVLVLSLRHSLHEKTVHYLLIFGAVDLLCIGVVIASFAWAMRRVDWPTATSPATPSHHR